MIGRRSARLDAREVGMAVLVPVGDDDECVGAVERVVVRLGKLESVAEPSLRLVHRHRVVGGDRGTGGEQHRRST